MTMKTAYWMSGIVVAGLLAFAGCGKSDKTKPIISGETVLQKFKEVFPAPTPEQQKNIFKVSQGIHYRRYPDALAALEGLDSDTSLTEPQKKAVADMRASIQQSITNAPPAAPQ
jgi:hypothetical protein